MEVKQYNEFGRKEGLLKRIAHPSLHTLEYVLVLFRNVLNKQLFSDLYMSKDILFSIVSVGAWDASAPLINYTNFICTYYVFTKIVFTQHNWGNETE